MNRRLATGFVVCFGLSLFIGCDLKKISELEEGVSTEADVRKRFGEPAAVYEDAKGEITLEYPRQPADMISIGPNGKMSSFRQVLTQTTFIQVTPGLDKHQVRRLLGRPAKVQSFALRKVCRT